MATKRLSKDHIDKFFDYDVDIDSRTIYMGSVNEGDGDGSGVDYLMAERVIKALHLLDYAAPSGDKPIMILMNNPGGDYLHGMAIYDAIRDCKNRVTIKAYGHAMSMGSIILQAADERQISPNSKFMIHYGYNSMSQNHAKIFVNWAKEEQRVLRSMEDLYLGPIMAKDAAMIAQGESDYMDRTLADILNKQNEGSIPPKPLVKVKLSKDPNKRREDVRVYIQTLLEYDTILTAAETVAIGLADEVFGE